MFYKLFEILQITSIAFFTGIILLELCTYLLKCILNLDLMFQCLSTLTLMVIFTCEHAFLELDLRVVAL